MQLTNVVQQHKQMM